MSDEIKLVFVQYFINNKRIIENIDFSDINRQNGYEKKSNIKEQEKLEDTENISNSNNQINIINLEDLQKQEEVNGNTGEISNSSKNDNELQSMDDELRNIKNNKAIINNENKSVSENNKQQINSLKPFIKKYSQRMFKLAVTSDFEQLIKEIDNIPDYEIIECTKFILSKKSINRL